MAAHGDKKPMREASAAWRASRCRAIAGLVPARSSSGRSRWAKPASPGPPRRAGRARHRPGDSGLRRDGTRRGRTADRLRWASAAFRAVRCGGPRVRERASPPRHGRDGDDRHFRDLYRRCEPARPADGCDHRAPRPRRGVARAARRAASDHDDRRRRRPMPVQYTTPVPSAQVKSSRAPRRAERPRRDGGDREGADPRPSSGCCAGSARR